jgi:hypothetical protein
VDWWIKVLQTVVNRLLSHHIALPVSIEQLAIWRELTGQHESVNLNFRTTSAVELVFIFQIVPLPVPKGLCSPIMDTGAVVATFYLDGIGEPITNGQQIGPFGGLRPKY